MSKGIFVAGLLFSCAVLAPVAAVGQQPQSTLQRIAETKTIKLGHLAEAAPFSFIDVDRGPAGYTIDLCQQVVSSVRELLKLDTLDVKWVPVTEANRFDKVADGTIDLECGTSTNTISRQKKVDFSLMIWVDGGNFLIKTDSTVKRITDLSGKKISVLGGTTTETALREALKRNGVEAEVVPVKQHLQGLEAMHKGEVDAYAGDQTVLIGLALAIGQQMPMKLSEENYSYEPFGLVLRRNDADFKQAVNQALARLYRTGKIVEIYDRWFGRIGKPSGLLIGMYTLNALPE